jgi:hypothetical protein
MRSIYGRVLLYSSMAQITDSDSGTRMPVHTITSTHAVAQAKLRTGVCVMAVGVELCDGLFPALAPTYEIKQP